MPTTPTIPTTSAQRRRSETQDTEVNFSSLSKSELRLVEAVRSTHGNPARALERKIEALAALLNCDEPEATRLFLHSL